MTVWKVTFKNETSVSVTLILCTFYHKLSTLILYNNNYSKIYVKSCNLMYQ